MHVDNFVNFVMEVGIVPRPLNFCLESIISVMYAYVLSPERELPETSIIYILTASLKCFVKCMKFELISDSTREKVTYLSDHPTVPPVCRSLVVK